MFILSTIKDIVRVQPQNFEKTRSESIIDELNKKYANKVLHNVGLCIALYDLVSIGEGVVHACQDGGYVSRVKFRLIVFRPFPGEILIGTIKSTSKEGLKISLGFFDDIEIPHNMLQPQSVYSSQENQFTWEQQDLVYEVGATIRFRVEMEEFFDVGPKKRGPNAGKMLGQGPGGVQGGSNQPGAGSISESEERPPYRIYASCHEEGFGPVQWWGGEEEEEEGEEGEGVEE